MPKIGKDNHNDCFKKIEIELYMSIYVENIFLYHSIYTLIPDGIPLFKKIHANSVHSLLPSCQLSGKFFDAMLCKNYLVTWK